MTGADAVPRAQATGPDMRSDDVSWCGSAGRSAKARSKHAKSKQAQTFRLVGYGGETGIRTLETVSRLHTFQACAFDHSATSPVLKAFYVFLLILQDYRNTSVHSAFFFHF